MGQWMTCICIRHFYILPVVWMFFFFFLKIKFLLIQNNNISHLNINIKVLKTLDNDAIDKFIAKINDLRPIQLIIII